MRQRSCRRNFHTKPHSRRSFSFFLSFQAGQLLALAPKTSASVGHHLFGKLFGQNLPTQDRSMVGEMEAHAVGRSSPQDMSPLKAWLPGDSSHLP